MEVAIVKYSGGNVCSVEYALRRLGVGSVVTDDVGRLRSAERVILPGVGEAGTAMADLRRRGLAEVLCSLRQPVLGICLGMQLLCRYSAEGGTACLGIVDAEVKRLSPGRQGEKTPHSGWNVVRGVREPLFDGSMEGSYVYFVHGYYVPLGGWTVARTEHIEEFSAALRQDNFYGVQFHPEKSGVVGERILRRFLSGL